MPNYTSKLGTLSGYKFDDVYTPPIVSPPPPIPPPVLTCPYTARDTFTRSYSGTTAINTSGWGPLESGGQWISDPDYFGDQDPPDLVWSVDGSKASATFTENSRYFSLQKTLFPRVQNVVVGMKVQLDVVPYDPNLGEGSNTTVELDVTDGDFEYENLETYTTTSLEFIPVNFGLNEGKYALNVRVRQTNGLGDHLNNRIYFDYLGHTQTDPFWLEVTGTPTGGEFRFWWDSDPRPSTPTYDGTGLSTGFYYKEAYMFMDIEGTGNVATVNFDNFYVTSCDTARYDEFFNRTMPRTYGTGIGALRDIGPPSGGAHPPATLQAESNFSRTMEINNQAKLIVQGDGGQNDQDGPQSGSVFTTSSLLFYSGPDNADPNEWDSRFAGDLTFTTKFAFDRVPDGSTHIGGFTNFGISIGFIVEYTADPTFVIWTECTGIVQISSDAAYGGLWVDDRNGYLASSGLCKHVETHTTWSPGFWYILKVQKILNPATWNVKWWKENDGEPIGWNSSQTLTNDPGFAVAVPSTDHVHQLAFYADCRLFDEFSNGDVPWTFTLDYIDAT